MRKIGSILLATFLGLTLTACHLEDSSNASSSSDITEHVHQCTKTREIPATCTREGNIEHWTCLICDKMFSGESAKIEIKSKDLIIPQKSHEAVYVAEVKESCGSIGNIEYWKCATCDKYFEDNTCTAEIEKSSVKIGMLPHSALTHHDAVATSGTQNGNIEYWYCSDCNNYYSNKECTVQITQEDTVVFSPVNIPDFIVEVETGRDPVVLQLTDTQIIDAAQARPGRGGLDYNFWATDQVEERCYDYITETIEATKPDFIILTGDIVYGEFDDSGSALLSLIDFMESFEIPWAPVFGNHDNESKKGVDWQCEQFENATYCLFEQKTLTGNGNYSVGITQGGVLKRVFYMLDSNGCASASSESLANGHTKTSAGFGQDQIEWYTEEIKAIKELSPDTKISFAYHIQQAIFSDAYKKYGFNQSQQYQNINIDTLENKTEGDFGYIGRQLKGPWDTSYSVWNGMKALGVDSVFVGHEHCNSASVVYEGVRFQFGQKSSEYDRFNCLNSDGSITGNYYVTGTSLIGGTVIPLSEETGEIKAPYIYLCGFAEDDNEGDNANEEKIAVNGLQYGGVYVTTADMYGDGSVTAKGVVFDETTNAYMVTANSQGKLYVNTALLKGKKTFTFTVYLPSTSIEKLQGYGEFAIRVKPNESEPSLDGKADGYIDFNSSASDPALRLEFGKWQTFTVDITGLDSTCTEFAFNIATGNILYVKDLAFY